MLTVELIYHAGCAAADPARRNLAAAHDLLGLPHDWREWDIEAPDAPPYVRQWPSPTVLVNGRDVNGSAPADVAAACRLAGAPGTDTIEEAIRAAAADAV
jgi:hypothetical protein